MRHATSLIRIPIIWLCSLLIGSGLFAASLPLAGVLAESSSNRVGLAQVADPLLLYASLLHEAAATGDIALLRYLLDRNADIDQRAELDRATALHRASRFGRTQAAQLLLSRGAAVDASAIGGHTALHMASAGGHSELAELLLDNGADIQAVSSGGSALHIAAREGHFRLVSLLLERGAAVNAKGGDYAATALILAAANGHRKIVAALLLKGADPDLRNREGTTALTAAWQARHNAVARLLRSAQNR